MSFDNLRGRKKEFWPEELEGQNCYFVRWGNLYKGRILGGKISCG